MKLVSIIIPVYNVSKFVSDCIDSVLQQSYKNIEIIIVNDGSTDGSGEICVQKASLDERIRYFEKENGGLSSARNYGLLHSKGDFVYFLDSDDFLTSNAIELLIREQIESDADIVSSSFKMVEEKQSISIGSFNATFTRGDNRLFFLQMITNQACAKLYKRTLFEGVSYPLGLHYEDIATTFKLYDKARIISHTDSGLYCYRVRMGAITSNIRKKDIDDMWKAYENVKRYYDKPEEDQIFYEATVLYAIYSRLLRSSCARKEFRINEHRIYSELAELNINLDDYKGKSPMYLKLKIFQMHLIKPIIRIIDLKRAVNMKLKSIW